MSATTTLEIKTPPTGPDAPPKVDDNRPAWLPEKFKTPEEMANAYKELETKQSTPPTADLSTTDAAKTALTAQGLDFAKLSAEYTANGKLADESMTALKAKGFSEAQVKQFIDGQNAIAEKNTNEVQSAVGGKERFDKLMEFAPNALTPAERESYNKAVETGDYGTVKLMLQGLNVKFEKAFGKDATLASGKHPETAVDEYSGFSEYRTAIRDPRYKTEPHYRALVDAKLARSSFVKQKTS